MNAQELIKAGKLSEARKQLVDEVKASPAKIECRTQLFQVLCFAGEWDKAMRHLEVIAAQGIEQAAGIQIYKSLVQAEKERMDVLSFKQLPSFMPETPAYFEAYHSAQKCLNEKKMDEAKTLLEQVIAQRPVVSGTLNGVSFAGFTDTDAVLSFVLEAIVYERYVWIPFESIRELLIEAPNTVFDLLWVPASITTWEGLSINSYLPALYPESYSHTDDRVKLGQITDWASLGGAYAQGKGQHVFEVGDTDTAILEIREAVFKLSAPAEPDENQEDES